MKCTHCGYDMPDHAKFCKMCGTPADADQTILADGEQNASPETQQRDYDFSLFEDNGAEPREKNRRDDRRAEHREHEKHPRHQDDERTRYESDREPYDDEYDAYDDRRSRHDGDRDETNRRGNRYAGKPGNNKKKKALIISAIALVLVIAIIIGTIVIINKTTVSAAELKDAKNKYLPPSQAVSIDTSLDDPSNDQIKFQYDDRARIISCTYSANQKPYDQRYTYNDARRSIHIDISYKDHLIFTKDIDYDKISTANVFEDVEGYYIRLDDRCFDNGSDAVVSAPQATVAPAPTEAETEELTEEPTEEPTEAAEATEAAKKSGSHGYLALYEDYMANLDSCDYNLANLIYLDDDDTPEILLSHSLQPHDYTILWITGDDTVASYTTYPAKSFWYTEKSGTFFTNNAITGISEAWLYSFDGSSVTASETDEQDPSLSNGPTVYGSSASQVRTNKNGGYYFHPGWH